MTISISREHAYDMLRCGLLTASVFANIHVLGVVMLSSNRMLLSIAENHCNIFSANESLCKEDQSKWKDVLHTQDTVDWLALSHHFRILPAMAHIASVTILLWAGVAMIWPNSIVRLLSTPDARNPLGFSLLFLFVAFIIGIGVGYIRTIDAKDTPIGENSNRYSRIATISFPLLFFIVSMAIPLWSIILETKWTRWVDDCGGIKPGMTEKQVIAEVSTHTETDVQNTRFIVPRPKPSFVLNLKGRGASFTIGYDNSGRVTRCASEWGNPD